MKSNLLLILATFFCTPVLLCAQVTLRNDEGVLLLQSHAGYGMHLDGILYVNDVYGTGDLVFKRNNILSGRLNESNENTSFGVASLLNNTGSYNSGFGYASLRSNTSGLFNTAVGDASLSANSTGSYNTALGRSVLYNSNGSENTAVGAGAMQNNISGSQNTSLGVWSLLSSSSGSYNTAAGSHALDRNTTGSYNTAVGVNANINNITGSNNTAVGYNATVASDGLFNAIAIGYDAVVNNSNKIRLGNTSITSLECQVSLSVTSDARFKYNVQQNVPGLDFIQKLKPVTYQFDLAKIETFTQTGIMPETINTAPGGPVHTGFLAQEVEKAATELGYDFDGVHPPQNEREYYTLDYTKFVMPLVTAIQEQQSQIKKQQAKITAQQEAIESLETSVTEMRHELNKLANLKTARELIAKNE